MHRLLPPILLTACAPCEALPPIDGGPEALAAVVTDAITRFHAATADAVCLRSVALVDQATLTGLRNIDAFGAYGGARRMMVLEDLDPLGPAATEVVWHELGHAWLHQHTSEIDQTVFDDTRGAFDYLAGTDFRRRHEVFASTCEGGEEGLALLRDQAEACELPDLATQTAWVDEHVYVASRSPRPLGLGDPLTVEAPEGRWFTDWRFESDGAEISVETRALDGPEEDLETSWIPLQPVPCQVEATGTPADLQDILLPGWEPVDLGGAFDDGTLLVATRRHPGHDPITAVLHLDDDGTASPVTGACWPPYTQATAYEHAWVGTITPEVVTIWPVVRGDCTP